MAVFTEILDTSNNSDIDPALGEFASCVVEQHTAKGVTLITPLELAQCIVETAFAVRRDNDILSRYPHLQSFIASGGDMCRMSARIYDVTKDNDPDFADAYQATSKLFFG